MMNKRKRAALAAAGATLILGAGTIGAYFTDQATAVNQLTISRVETEITEPKWSSVPDSEKNHVTPNQTIVKDPTVTNKGTVDQFVFVKVTMPCKTIVTANEDGTKNPAANTDLFTMNSFTEMKNKKYAGLHKNTVNAGWTLLSDEAKKDNHVYTYVWGSDKECTPLAAGSSTTTLFSGVTMCNAVEGQGLEDSASDINLDVYAIQTTDLTDADTVIPSEVLSVYYNQNR